MLLPRVAIGDHTYTHGNMAQLRKGLQRDEIVSTAATMNALGEPAPRLFRPPYGAFNQDTLSLMQQRGMALILWSIDSEDYTRPGVDQIVANVVGNAAPGSIVLMHDGGGDRSQTALAVPKIVHRLRERGYKFVTVPELIERSPPIKSQQDVATPPPGAAKGAG
jgi:peptidoglycan/xylan/chitin deacetylase (PgdA/CDA1 family)